MVGDVRHFARNISGGNGIRRLHGCEPLFQPGDGAVLLVYDFRITVLYFGEIDAFVFIRLPDYQSVFSRP